MPYLQDGVRAGFGAWLGIVAITTGVALVGLAHKGNTLHHGQTLGRRIANRPLVDEGIQRWTDAQSSP